MRSVLVLIVLLALGGALAWSSPARAQGVQRCTTLSGDTVYTDKRCEDIGAVDRLPNATSAGVATAGPLYRGGCSRTLSDLVHQITAAIDAKDVNRLAGVYLWSGASDATANRILDRMEAIVQRPLVDIVPIRPEPPPILDEAGNVVDLNADGYYPQYVPQQRPVGLRIIQTLKNSATPSNTTLGLRRAYNCFWITL
ncbi:hypothetical protein [Pseudoxanthomonas putridarboris]|uniref:DUF4124 domain-containing protein n=1 Tax=Pseudoxanthomonas putridarboris TaxID=752605 RepID=A0ABU9J5E4_9GAMM